MFKTIALVLALLVAGVLVFATTRPDSFRVQRMASIKAPPEKIFPLLNDLRQWQQWSPWEKLDPAMQRTYSGPAQGKGAAYAWQGNGKVGQGRMEISDSQVPARLAIQLDFIKSFETRNVAEFTLQPQGDTTAVTWVMQGPCPYLSKLMGLFVSMDSLVGKDFEAGLGNLKAIAEK